MVFGHIDGEYQGVSCALGAHSTDIKQKYQVKNSLHHLFQIEEKINNKVMIVCVKGVGMEKRKYKQKRLNEHTKDLVDPQIIIF